MTHIVLCSLIFISCGVDSHEETHVEYQPDNKVDWVIAIHGGAGEFEKEQFTKEQRQAYERDLTSAIDLGSNILSEGGDALDAIEMVIQSLEDSPLFNAGKGAVFTASGSNELDASIMDGRNLNCGAVTGLTNIRNPISAARAVMEKSEHVFLSGKGATTFSLEQGLEWADSSYFKTDRRWNRYLELRGEQMALFESTRTVRKFGTVGCVVLDMNGNLAAGTSTGGMMMKSHGRIGDSPVIAAGTYADNATCAVSCTGHGEFFIRAAVAYDISARMGYGGQSLEEAAAEVIHSKLASMGGSGGIIAVDSQGAVVLDHNTTGMFCASRSSEDDEALIFFEHSSVQNKD